jgi:hypothetical protein
MLRNLKILKEMFFKIIFPHIKEARPLPPQCAMPRGGDTF